MREHPDWSNADVVRECRVSPLYVAKVRGELGMTPAKRGGRRPSRSTRPRDGPSAPPTVNGSTVASQAPPPGPEDDPDDLSDGWNARWSRIEALLRAEYADLTAAQQGREFDLANGLVTLGQEFRRACPDFVEQEAPGHPSEERFMETTRKPLSNGAGMIRFFIGSTLTILQMLAEWIDNALGADADKIVIRWRRREHLLEIEDDGHGCEDLEEMESLARSGRKPGDRAAMYGIGGVMSQICMSRGGVVEVTTTTPTRKGYIKVDWNACLVADELFSEHGTTARPPKVKTGTTIKIHGAKSPGDVAKLVAGLGYHYAGALKAGKSITLLIDDQRHRIRPYHPPPFEAEVHWDFVLDNLPIKGYTAAVAASHANPHAGWSIDWGYRIAMKFPDPAGPGRSAHRIFGMVYLPRGGRGSTRPRIPSRRNCSTGSPLRSGPGASRSSSPPRSRPSSSS